MERVQLQFIIMLMAAYSAWCISAESIQITPLTIRSNANGMCPSEIMRDNALQLLKNATSAILSNISGSTTTESPTDAPVVLLQSSLIGGTGGSYFNDYDDNNNITGIVGMRIRAGDQIDSIQVTYRLNDGTTFTAPRHGGTGGTEFSFTLADGEKLTRMEGMTYITGVAVNMLTFYNNLNNVYGPYGTIGLRPFSVTASEIVAFFGRVGGLMDAIGVYYTN